MAKRLIKVAQIQSPPISQKSSWDDKKFNNNKCQIFQVDKRDTYLNNETSKSGSYAFPPDNKRIEHQSTEYFSL